MPGNVRPSGFKGAGPRPGGPSIIDWYVVFTGADGKRLVGGSAVVQWYALEVAADKSVTSPVLGEAVETDALQVRSKGVGAGLWPWCTVVATPPMGAEFVEIVTTPGAVAEAEIDVPTVAEIQSGLATSAGVTAATAPLATPATATTAILTALDEAPGAPLARVTGSGEAAIVAKEVEITAYAAAGAATAIDSRNGAGPSDNWVSEVVISDTNPHELIPSSGDPSYYNDLLGFQISVHTAAAKVSINVAGEGAFYEHTYPANTTAFVSLGSLATSDGKGIVRRATNAAIQIVSSNAGATVYATPVYRGNGV